LLLSEQVVKILKLSYVDRLVNNEPLYIHSYALIQQPSRKASVSIMMFCTELWVYYAIAEPSVTLLKVGSFLPPNVEFLRITFVFSAGRLTVSELSGTLLNRGVASPLSSQHSLISF